MTKEEALRQLREAQERQERRFLYATTTEAVEMRIWNGKEPIEQNIEKRVIPAGTRVLVNAISKTGSVGIRNEHLFPPSVGYYALVLPEKLTNWKDSV